MMMTYWTTALTNTAKKYAIDLLQVVNFTSLLELVNNWQQTCQFHQVPTNLLKSGLLNLSFGELLQLIKTTCRKPVDNKF